MADKLMKLDKFDSTALLITKGWTCKGIPKLYSESHMEYGKRFFAEQVGVAVEQVDSLALWFELVSKVCTRQELLEIIKRSTRDPAETLEQVMIGVLSATMSGLRFEFDWSLIVGGMKDRRKGERRRDTAAAKCYQGMQRRRGERRQAGEREEGK